VLVKHVLDAHSGNPAHASLAAKDVATNAFRNGITGAPTVLDVPPGEAASDVNERILDCQAGAQASTAKRFDLGSRSSLKPAFPGNLIVA